MPVYMYRREDGTTFEYKQKFSDDPLVTDPETGQPVVRVIQASGVIFKGSGFYINDSKGASKNSLNGSSANGKSNGNGENSTSDAKAESSTTSEKSEKSDSAGKSEKSETKSESKSEKKSETPTPSK